MMAKRQRRPIQIDGNTAYVTLTKGFVAIIDSADVHLVSPHSWHADTSIRTTYAASKTKKRGHLAMHRLLMCPPFGMVVDHVDGNTLNNRRSNLRVATVTQNSQNSKIRSHNKSGFKGVCWIEKRRKWLAQIAANKKSKQLGFFDTAEEAHAAYKLASQTLHGEFSRFA